MHCDIMIHPYGSSYLETRVLSATPLELVGLLYEGAIEAVRNARHHLACGDIRERGRSVAKALDILAELSSSLDREAGGEIGASLSVLYDFIERSLIDANFRQDEQGLKDAEGLLTTLHEGWSAITDGAAAAAYPRSA